MSAKRLVFILLIVLTAGTTGVLVYLMGAERSLPSLLAEAESLEKGGDVRGAVYLLQEILTEDPHHCEALRRLATLARDQGQFRAAAGYWRILRGLEPLNSSVREKEFVNRLAYGDFRTVIESLEGQGQNVQTRNENLLLARAFLQSGRSDDAQALLTQALADNPSDETARLLSADIQFANGETELAERLYRDLISTPTVAAAANIGVGNCLLAARPHLAKRPFELAENRVKLADELEKGSFQAARILANHYRNLGETEKATRIWSSLRKRYPWAPEVIIPLAECLTAEGSISEVTTLIEELPGGVGGVSLRHYLEAILAHSREEYDTTLQFLGWSREFAGSRPLFQWLELESSIRSGDLARARQAFRKLDETRSLSWSGDRVVSFLEESSYEAWEGNEIALAKSLSKWLLELQPANQVARVNLMRLTLSDGRWNEARSQANDILAVYPNSEAALEVRGRALLALREPEAAEEDFARLISINPGSPLGEYWLGVAFSRRGHFNQSAIHLENAHRRYPESLKISAALYAVYLETDNATKALSLAEQLTSQSSGLNQSVGHSFRAGIHRINAEPALAIKEYQLAINAAPNRIPYYLAKADIEMESGKYREARVTLGSALRIDSDHLYTRFKIALCEHRSGARETAIQLYRNLLQDYPDWSLVLVNLSGLLCEDPLEKTEAVSLAQRAVDLTPNWAEAHYHLAESLRANSRDEEARSAYEKALSLDKDLASAGSAPIEGESL